MSNILQNKEQDKTKGTRPVERVPCYHKPFTIKGESYNDK